MTEQEEKQLANRFVSWVYYFNRNQLSIREYDGVQRHKAIEFLLNFSCSVQPNSNRFRFNGVLCLKCGTIHHGILQQLPYIEDCAYCAINNKPLDFIDLKAKEFSLTNPCNWFFTSLPLNVQIKVHQILLDLGTYSLYNNSTGE